KKDSVPPLNGMPVRRRPADEKKKEQRSEPEDEDEQPKRAPARPSAPANTMTPITLFYKSLMLLALCGGLAWGMWFVVEAAGGAPSLAGIIGSQALATKVFAISFVIFLALFGPSSISRADFAAAFAADPAYREDPEAASMKKELKSKHKAKKRKKAQAAEEADLMPDQTPTLAQAAETASEAGKEEKEKSQESESEDNAAARSMAEARADMLKFFEFSVTYLNAHQESSGLKLDTLTTFGCLLFFAGGGEALSRARGINTRYLAVLIEPCVLALGRSSEWGAKFAKRYEEYLLEPGYADMFGAGNDAMVSFLGDLDSGAEDEETAAAPKVPVSPSSDDYEDDDDQGDIGIFLVHALESWAKPGARRKGDGMLAVLFTDIVGSTSFTQEHGDEASQRLLNVHNAIVRNAIKNRGGREVKHTGDGILASYPQSGMAVESAAAMLRDADKHNAASPPELQLHLRIGINAGQPIQEDGDIFGTTVQLAARLCDAAGTDQILVTNVVREMSQGRAVKFRSAGERDMKGVSEPVPVIEAIWRKEEEEEKEKEKG
ncbi:MAG: adenylate/guanylate cyclase domain-containing protein, partial [Alphaproteobacteria bacterium]|nr:adenylate/guanylate cyclase domain-containing protein [Alphaproteobacteria bacterium]